MANAGQPPSTRRRVGGRGTADGIDAALPSSSASAHSSSHSLDSSNGSSHAAAATATHRRWRGGGVGNNLQPPSRSSSRSSRSILVWIIQLIAIFAIATLVAIALDWHGASSSSSSSGGSTSTAIDLASSSENRIISNEDVSSTATSSLRIMAHDDIQALENELHSLSVQVRRVSNEIAKLVAADDVGSAVVAKSHEDT